MDKAKVEVDRALYCSAKPIAQKEQSISSVRAAEFENRTLFRAVKLMVGKNRDVVGAGSVKGLDGRIVTGEAEVKDRWKDYFDKFHPSIHPWVQCP